MKPSPLYRLLLLFSSLASLATADVERVNFFTACTVRDPSHKPYNATALDQLVQTWHAAFGDGGGTLRHGYGGAPTYQAVCCEGWCLYAERVYNEYDYSWSAMGFAHAVEELRWFGPGSGGCESKMPAVRGGEWGKVTLKMKAGKERVFVKMGAARPVMRSVWEEFGDTCEGAEGYNGPG